MYTVIISELQTVNSISGAQLLKDRCKSHWVPGWSTYWSKRMLPENITPLRTKHWATFFCSKHNLLSHWTRLGVELTELPVRVTCHSYQDFLVMHEIYEAPMQ